MTGEETPPGEGDAWQTLIQDNTVLIPTKIGDLR